jgi:DNA-binding transcriptional LysR family regulator
VRLLNRTSRKLSLTESGEALHERCRAILDEVSEAEALASSSAVKPRGRLRINAPLSFGVLHLAPLWSAFMRKYPDVELEVSLIDRVVDIVEEGYDLAIRISRAGSVSHVGRKLATSRNIVCASPDYVRQRGAPSAPTDLKDHACIGYTYSATADEWRFTDGAGKPHAVKVAAAMRTNNGDTARVMALAGQAITWQPTFLIGEDLKAGRLVPLMPDYRMADIDILAVYPSRRHLGAKVRVTSCGLDQAAVPAQALDRSRSRGSGRSRPSGRRRRSCPSAARTCRAERSRSARRAVGRGQHPALLVQQHHARAGALLGRQAHAVDHRLGLGLPVEVDAQHAQDLAIGLAALADGGGVGGDRGVVQGLDPLDVAGDEVVARGGAHRLAEPGRVGDRGVAGGGIAIGAAGGDDPTPGVADPQVQIDGVGVEDHPRRWLA